MPVMVELARPKVNLSLRVLGRSADGYHELESLVAFADGMADRITLEPAHETSVTVEGPAAAGIAGENLIRTTLQLLADAAPGLVLGKVTLQKTLPVASGIGGGSADAAAVMRAVARANPGLASAVPWHGIARRLGADVPVCLLDRAAMMRGVGERLEPLPSFPPLPAVLVNPMVRVPENKTAEVFRRLAAPTLKEPLPVEAPAPAGRAQDILAYIEAAGNDLTAPAQAVVPEIAGVLKSLTAEARCHLARMSGAGPTCFGLFETWRAAEEAARRMSELHPGWWTAAVTLA